MLTKIKTRIGKRFIKHKPIKSHSIIHRKKAKVLTKTYDESIVKPMTDNTNIGCVEVGENLHNDPTYINAKANLVTVCKIMLHHNARNFAKRSSVDVERNAVLLKINNQCQRTQIKIIEVHTLQIYDMLSSDGLGIMCIGQLSCCGIVIGL